MIENSCNEGRFTDRPFFVFNRGWYVMMGGCLEPATCARLGKIERESADENS